MSKYAWQRHTCYYLEYARQHPTAWDWFDRNWPQIDRAWDQILVLHTGR